ncbi:F0F1 ATP synthase subunit delta [Bacteroides sp. 214]|uniref:F0F1 ATP synthase subunit delta n=1 Tax=Bacteroides sp. 214 TaxID=2302935 RepID=UPI0013D7F161|nr:F0F1 ATP synthase subunit delta [Bacteroides sp. 214]NDW12771.1 F0F1 ATP synthase subunit delta [Bacteroides sp. 214]
MDIGILSVRYSKALLAYAQEEKQEDVVYEEMKSLARSFHNHPRLNEVVTNPILPAQEKEELIIAAAVGEATPSATLINFIRLILKNKRESLFYLATLTYIELYHKLKHIAVGTLITAVPVDAATKERIRQTASAAVHAPMKLKTVVDPAIEGGFIFDINDYRLDASVTTQLKKVKQQFIDKNRRIV